MEEYFNECSRYMNCALQLLPYSFKTNSYIHLLKYPASSSKNDSLDNFWLEEHTDKFVLTILPHAEVPGLQILTKEKKWIDVHLPKEFLVLLIGDGLQWRSVGDFQATQHRVVIPGGEWKGCDRYSTILGAFSY
jgi:isopenicillin N synthase-like dioxygenase